MLNSRSGSEVAIELGDYLDKTLGTTTHLAQVKQEISGGRLLSAVSALIQESAHLWTTESAADKGMLYYFFGNSQNADLQSPHEKQKKALPGQGLNKNPFPLLTKVRIIRCYLQILKASMPS